jgi:ribosomal protein S27AE
MPKKHTPVVSENPAVTLGRKGGLANTVKQQRARKLNAQRAGRPRRICTHCGEAVIGGHVDRALDTKCGAHGWRWQTRAERYALAHQNGKTSKRK